MGYRDYSTAKGHIVDSTGHGDFTNITDALSAASSGQTIFIRPGTYTENLTLKSGVNIAAFSANEEALDVTIIGKLSFSSSGEVSIYGVELQTNSDYFLSVTGTNASVVNIQNCYLNCLNNTGINFNNSNTQTQIKINYCTGDIGTTGITFCNVNIGTASSTFLYIINSIINNSGASSTASTCSNGLIQSEYSELYFPISTSSTGGFSAFYSIIDSSATNSIALLLNGTGTSQVLRCSLSSGTASSISIGASAIVPVAYCDVKSSNAFTLTGAGTMNYSFICFSGSSSGHNVITETAYSTI